ncbi:hypothetical protein CHLRE_12g557250v5 [Chlamydomonas reinhardtii]|uniref:Dynamin N-terminal domain-containing protein n=1 Tax=Chlamydomonas reinhardtii TaxID=3055 RepID=A8JGY8_CHLRE|nr:uncharacterized protein CHLRE_12g557250v5 [Chlamydomonas reinhardtii]XP_042918887.1 uncharacterized protein CHLRE_12g557250v5 [Chlamydomonas reinhardtii]PNW75864.1 hypothetical protein CHLRE_12g557250v5 [Chlamydomonas reinhardtii]PNW75865.1 hypothetical protein CHLRE_12g557250v5 [Chlamydomonas reinhardtii]|eukprot:XP_001702853.1 sarcaleumin-like protein [Chlamydomonas reinhardtii]
MVNGPAKRKSGKTQMEEIMSGATEKVLKQITDLYDFGLGDGPGAIGLKAIAESPLLRMTLRKPRKKISVMIVGNHSAGKSSFINWYIGESIQKTGVAIETRGFTFVTSGKKRETLQGDATVRFYDHLNSFGDFNGIMANLFTEISTSRDKNFSCVDLIDTPGLVDGDMQYPFNVQDAIVWMADHVDLILIFFDPIGQATCKRCMEVVERLNNGPHLEKIHYFMSKADAVDKEHDRQRVLIQITQNLATRIRNSHAFNLPTFYLPRDESADCTIPNAIEDVCKEIDKSINMTVQKNLKQLKTDCERILARAEEVKTKDREQKATNVQRTMQGVLLALLTLAAAALMGMIFTTRFIDTLCSEALLGHLCDNGAARAMQHVQPTVTNNFNSLFGAAAGLVLVLMIVTKLTWRVQPVLTKKQLQQIDSYAQVVKRIAEQEDNLYKDYFKTLSTMEH